MTYFWPENGHCIVFDEGNVVLDEIYTFIEEAIDVGESVLVHSTDGVSRAAFCSSVYFMLKYRWCGEHCAFVVTFAQYFSSGHMLTTLPPPLPPPPRAPL